MGRYDSVILASALAAQRDAAIMRMAGKYSPTPVTAADIDEGRSGRAFKIECMVPEGIDSGDKRHFMRGSLGFREFPLPLLWQQATGEGHDGAVIVGRIDHAERTADGLGNAYGVFDTGPYGREAQRLVENGFIRFGSVDLDNFEVFDELSQSDPKGRMIIKKGRAMAWTLVAKPAFQQARIELLPLAEEETMTELTPSGIAASAGIAAAIPVEPPADWFSRPPLNGPSPITVDNSGRIFGHIATWNTDHVGMANSIRPPRSRSSYAYFHTGVVRTSEGSDVSVGQLTLSGGHADIRLDATAAAKHYDDTHSAIADVHAGEDEFGIWVAGALRPGTTAAQIRALRASAPSGDWRYIPGAGLELIGICQVNVPGFPVPRALAASGVQQYALVAAGTADLLEMKRQQAAAATEFGLREWVGEFAEEDGTAEFNWVEEAGGLPKYIKRIEKHLRAKGMTEGHAIATAVNVVKKMCATGDVNFPGKQQVNPGSQAEACAAVAEWEAKKAKAKADNSVGEDPAAIAAAARARVFRSLDVDGYITSFKDFSPEQRDKLAKKGAARPDGSYPIETTADLRRAIQAYGRAKDDEKGAVRRHIVKRARALGKEKLIPDNWTEASMSDKQLALRDKYAVVVASARAARYKAEAEAALAKIKRPELEAQAALLRQRMGITADAGGKFRDDDDEQEEIEIEVPGLGEVDEIIVLPEDAQAPAPEPGNEDIDTPVPDHIEDAPLTPIIEGEDGDAEPIDPEHPGIVPPYIEEGDPVPVIDHDQDPEEDYYALRAAAISAALKIGRLK